MRTSTLSRVYSRVSKVSASSLMNYGKKVEHDMKTTTISEEPEQAEQGDADNLQLLDINLSMFSETNQEEEEKNLPDEEKNELESDHENTKEERPSFGYVMTLNWKEEQ